MCICGRIENCQQKSSICFIATPQWKTKFKSVAVWQNSCSSWTSCNPKREAEMCSKFLVNISRRYVQENLNSYQRCCESLICLQVVVASSVNGTSDWAVQLNTLVLIGQVGWIYSCVLDSAVEHVNLYCVVRSTILIYIGQWSWTQYFVLGSWLNTLIFIGQCSFTQLILHSAVEHINVCWAVPLNSLICIGQCGWTQLILHSAVEHINVCWAVLLNSLICIGQAVEHNWYCTVRLNTLMCVGPYRWTRWFVLGSAVQHNWYCTVRLNTLMCVGPYRWTRWFILGSAVEHNWYCAVQLNTLMCIGQYSWTH